MKILITFPVFAQQKTVNIKLNVWQAIKSVFNCRCEFTPIVNGGDNDENP